MSLRFAGHAAVAALETLTVHHLPRAALHALAMRRLRALVAHAIEKVPYYREVYGRAGIAPERLTGLSALTTVPTIDKSVLREHQDRLFANDAPPRSELAMRRSSGSSGRPSETFFDPIREVRRRTQELRLLASLGVRPTDRQLIVDDPRNRPARPLFVQRLGLWRREQFPFDAPVDEAVAAMERLAPDVVHGVLTPIRMLANHLEASGKSLRMQPRLVLTKGELLDAATRALVERTFRAPVRDYYATEEVGIVAAQQRTGDHYEVDEDFVFVECLRPGGTPTDDGEPGELVLTNLYQRAMPIIRFRTGDFGVLWRDGLNGSGRPALTGLLGRRMDCIATPDGRVLAPFVFMVALESDRRVRWFRVRQRDETTVDVALALDPEVRGEALECCSAEITSALQQAVGPSMRVSVRIDAAATPIDVRKSPIVTGLPGLVERRLAEGGRIVF